ncbi:MAG: hypothetical protein GY947_12545 [Rhodobacteraceae bacterium]|nr:hypothetical protein [Paracoccaceae bacterium]
MTHASLTNPVSKNVASRHDATVLRGAKKTPLEGSSKRRPTPANMPLAPAAQAVTWSQRRSVRLKGESPSTDCSAASKQNPIRVFADSGLLEQII